MKEQEKALEEISCNCRSVFSCEICSTKSGVVHKINQYMLNDEFRSEFFDSMAQCEQEIANEIIQKKNNSRRTKSTGPKP